MTAYIAFKALEEGKLKPDQKLTVSEKAWKVEGSRMFLKAHSEVPVWDLMRGLIVVSGNDAAITLAEGIAGSEEAFAKMMNDEAKRLGMTQTYFENATGLPAPKHLTSANDLAILSAAIIRDLPAKYYEVYSYKSYTYNNITQENRNLLLFRDDSVDGLNTGHTSSAGYNLIATSKRNNRRVLSIVIGAASAEARATEMVSKAIAEGGTNAINYFVAQEYVRALGKFAESEQQKTVFMPMEASGIIGALGGIAEMFNKGEKKG